MKPLKKCIRGALMVTTITVMIGNGELKAQATTDNTEWRIPSDQVGLRMGAYSGITYRHFGEKPLGFEASIMNWLPEGGAILSALLEKNIPIRNNFVFYYGVGLFAGNYYSPYYPMDYMLYDGYYTYRRSVSAGVEGMVDLEYLIPKTPLVVGLDLRPRILFLNYPFPWDAGLNIRYRIK
jgi:hypothetical protein